MAQRLPIGRTDASMDSNCYRPAFYHACERGDLAEIRRHLDEGAKLEGQSLPLGRTGDGVFGMRRDAGCPGRPK